MHVCICIMDAVYFCSCAYFYFIFSSLYLILSLSLFQLCRHRRLSCCFNSIYIHCLLLLIRLLVLFLSLSFCSSCLFQWGLFFFCLYVYVFGFSLLVSSIIFRVAFHLFINQRNFCCWFNHKSYISENMEWERERENERDSKLCQCTDDDNYTQPQHQQQRPSLRGVGWCISLARK